MKCPVYAASPTAVSEMSMAVPQFIEHESMKTRFFVGGFFKKHIFLFCSMIFHVSPMRTMNGWTLGLFPVLAVVSEALCSFLQ